MILCILGNPRVWFNVYLGPKKVCQEKVYISPIMYIITPIALEMKAA